MNWHCPDCNGELVDSDTGEPDFDPCFWCDECKRNVFLWEWEELGQGGEGEENDE